MSIHKISGGFDPSAYEYIEYFDYYSVEVYIGDEYFGGESVNPLDPEIEKELNAHGESSDKCSHCGSRLTRGEVHRHRSGKLAVFGLDCAMRLEFKNREELRHHLKARRVYIAGLRKAMRANYRWRIVIPALSRIRDNRELFGDKAANIAEDMLRKLSKYFGLSRKQISFIHRLALEGIWWEHESKFIEAEREREKKEALKSKPLDESKRVRIEGELICVKEQETDWGINFKGLIKLETGQKVWISVKGTEAERGDRVACDCRVTRSGDDPTFYFGSRPTKWVMEKLELV